MNYFKIITNGIIKENPTFVLLLGMCPTLATTTSSINGMSMGLATMFVLICSNVVVSLIKNLTPDKVRIPVFVVVIASFVTLLQLCHPRTCRGLRMQEQCAQQSVRRHRYWFGIYSRTHPSRCRARITWRWS